MTLPPEPHGGEPLPVELEAALMIVSDQPAEVANQIADLRELGSFRLIPQPTQNLYDVYFDTPDRLLAARGFGLRVRECGTERCVTLKGQTATPDAGPLARFELELPWQRRNLHRIVGELARRGIPLPGRIRRFDSQLPAAVMSDLGLDTVQRRSNQRLRRNVVPARAASNTALAELAVDTVRYHLETRDVLLYEIEIEAADSGDHDLLVTLSEQLVKRFGPALRSWTFSKLATGAAIAELDSTAALEARLHADATLAPAAIETIARHLAQRNR